MLTILIVDDQPGIRTLLKEVTEQLGCTTFQAANGITALQILQEKRPDLVILDLKMPGMDGIEVLHKIRTIHPNQKVIVITAYAELNLLEKAQELGILTHITKPFDIYELSNEIMRHSSFTNDVA